MTLWYMFNDEDYEYEVDWKDLKRAFEKIFKDIAKVKNNECIEIERLLYTLINERYIYDITELQEEFKEELTDYFYSEAEQKYIDGLNYYDGSDDYYRDKI